MKIIKLVVLSFAVLMLATNLMAQQSAPAATPEKTAPVTTPATAEKTAPATMNAPTGAPGMSMAEHRAMMLKDKLKLSDTQADQVKTIIMDSEKQGQADREKLVGKPEDMKKAGMERRQATETKIMALLNPEQKKEYSKMKDSMHGMGKPAMHQMEMKKDSETKKPAETK